MSSTQLRELKIAKWIENVKYAHLWWSSCGNEVACHDFNALFDSLCEGYTEYPCAELAAAVLHYLPDLCFAGSMQNTCHIEKSTHDAVVRILSNAEYLASLLNMYEGEKRLAWFCCTNAVSYQYQDADEYTDAFRDVLSKWTGRLFPNVFDTTLENVVTHLYGPAMWELYGPDDIERLTVFDFHKLVNKINSSLFPIVKQKIAPPIAAGILPGNMV